MVSRYFVIGLAFVGAALRASQGAWLESAGLSSLGVGLVVLRLSAARPALKPVAYVAFGITLATFTLALSRRL